MKKEHAIIAASLGFGILFWVLDAMLDAFFFYEGSILDLLIFDVPSQELYMRLLSGCCFLLFGLFLSKIVARNERTKKELSIAKDRLAHVADSTKASGDLGVTVSDITEYRQSENEINRAKDEYLTITNLTGDIIIQTDKDGKWIFLNNFACEFWGRPKDELLGVNFADYVHPEDVENTQTAILRMIETKKEIRGFVNRQDTPGGWRTVEWNAIPTFDEKGELTKLQATGRDITKHMQTEKALCLAHDKLNATLDALPDLLFEVDRHGNIIDYRANNSKRLYTEPQNFLGRNVRDVLPQEVWEIAMSAIEETVATGRSSGKSYKIDIPSHGAQWYELSAASRGNPGTQDGCIIVLARDVTDRKNAEEEAKLRYQQLVQANKMVSLGILVSGVAHEINNPNQFIMTHVAPLQKIWKNVRPILDRYLDENGDFSVGGASYSVRRDQIPAMFDSILEGSKRIKNIVEDLRNYVREKPVDRSETIHINSVVTSALMLLSSQLRKSASNLYTEYGTDLPTFQGNYQKLEQVVINLVQNSCDALADKDADIYISTSYNFQNGHIVLKVQDTGMGISKDLIEHMTDPFFTTKRDSGGTGLGLSISSSIVAEHGGTLNFSSEQSNGALAIVTIPTWNSMEAIPVSLFEETHRAPDILEG